MALEEPSHHRGSGDGSLHGLLGELKALLGMRCEVVHQVGRLRGIRDGFLHDGADLKT